MLALGAAYADGDAPAKPSYHVTIDRVDHEPASITGTRLQIELSALTLQGQLIDLTDPKVIKTYVGNSEIKQPFALGTFRRHEGQGREFVIVVQTTSTTPKCCR